MLTKSELNEKKAKSGNQLDLVETISTEDQSKKKRRFLYIALFVTIGISFIFWAYRQLQHFTFPTISVPTVSTNSLDSQITSLISSDKSKWNVSIYTDKVTNWSKNTNNFDYQSIEKILSTQKNNSSFTKSILPQGLDIKENYLETNSKITLNSLITTPKKQILIMATIEGDNTIQSKPLLSELVTSIYWDVINR